MSRTDRNPHSRDAVFQKQAMVTTQRILPSEIATIAASPAARQLSLFSPQEKVPATVAPSDEVRGEVSRVETPDF